MWIDAVVTQSLHRVQEVERLSYNVASKVNTAELKTRSVHLTAKAAAEDD